MTGPTQNQGTMAQGMKLAQALVDGMAFVIPKVGASTPIGMAIAKAMIDIGKTLPPSQGPNDGLKQMALKSMQMAPHQAAMKANVPGGAPPGGGASPPPTAAPG